jgi:hypothetical protein
MWEIHVPGVSKGRQRVPYICIFYLSACITGYLMVVSGHKGQAAPVSEMYCGTSASTLTSLGKWKNPCGIAITSATVSPMPVDLTTALRVVKENVAHFVNAVLNMKAKYVSIFLTLNRNICQ